MRSWACGALNRHGDFAGTVGWLVPAILACVALEAAGDKAASSSSPAHAQDRAPHVAIALGLILPRHELLQCVHTEREQISLVGAGRLWRSWLGRHGRRTTSCRSRPAMKPCPHTYATCSTRGFGNAAAMHTLPCFVSPHVAAAYMVSAVGAGGDDADHELSTSCGPSSGCRPAHDCVCACGLPDTVAPPAPAAGHSPPPRLNDLRDVVTLSVMPRHACAVVCAAVATCGKCKASSQGIGNHHFQCSAGHSLSPISSAWAQAYLLVLHCFARHALGKGPDIPSNLAGILCCHCAHVACHLPLSGAKLFSFKRVGTHAACTQVVAEFEPCNVKWPRAFLGPNRTFMACLA